MSEEHSCTSVMTLRQVSCPTAPGCTACPRMGMLVLEVGRVPLYCTDVMMVSCPSLHLDKVISLSWFILHAIQYCYLLEVGDANGSAMNHMRAT